MINNVKDAAKILLDELDNLFDPSYSDESNILMWKAVFDEMKRDYILTVDSGLPIDYPAMFVSAIEELANWNLEDE